jgi:hypothetical protein
MEIQDRNLLFSAMNTGIPIHSYVKTILGRVYINVWDTMTNQPMGLLLSGDPRKSEDSCIYDVWSEQENVFFKRMNKRHFETGTIIEYKRKTENEPVKTIESSTDDELKAILTAPFLKLQHVLNATESIALLFRIKNMAVEMEKSEKIVRAIDSRIAEIQQAEFVEPEQKTVEL